MCYVVKDGYIILHLYVVPKARVSEIAGIYNERIKIKVKAAPEGGKANEEVVEKIALFLKIPRANVTLIKGASSRNKDLRIDCLDNSCLNLLSQLH